MLMISFWLHTRIRTFCTYPHTVHNTCKILEIIDYQLLLHTTPNLTGQQKTHTVSSSKSLCIRTSNTQLHVHILDYIRFTSNPQPILYINIYIHMYVNTKPRRPFKRLQINQILNPQLNNTIDK